MTRRPIPVVAALRVAAAAASLLAAVTAVPAQAAARLDLVSAKESPGTYPTYYPTVAVSGNGRYVAYRATFHPVTQNAVDGTVPCCFDLMGTTVIPKTVQALYLADLQTKKQTRVIADGCCTNGLSLSRDGRYLVFDSISPDLVPGDRNGVTDVFVYDAKTKKLARLLNVHGGELEKGATVGVVSADGGTIVFNSRSDVLAKRNQQDPPCALYSYSLRTRKTTPVIVGGTTICSFSSQIAVSSDAKYLAVLTLDSFDRSDTGANDVYWVDVARKRAVLVSVPPGTTDVHDPENMSPTIDGAGRLVGWSAGPETSSFNANQKVMLRDVRSGRLIDVNWGLLGAGSNDTEWPRLSEDGRWLTFVDNRGELTEANGYDFRGVYVRDLRKDVSTTRRLEPLAAGCTQPGCLRSSSIAPAISSDGRVIAYLTTTAHSPDDDDQTYDVYAYRS